MLLKLSLLLTATLATANAASFTTFQVPGCGQTTAAAINDHRVVVGTTNCGGIATAFIRDVAGHFTTFTVDGNPTTATGINIHGAVVGTYGDTHVNCGPLPCIFPYVRSPDGVITTIVGPGGSPVNFAIPFAINASGQVAGTTPPFLPAPQAWFRDVDGTFTGLNLFEQGFKGAVVTGLNDAGEIAGAAFLPPADVARAFIRDPKTGTLNIVGPLVSFLGATWVIGINRLGDVVGYVSTINLGNNSITTQGFTQTATGAPKLFPVPFTVLNGGLPFSRLVGGGINARGEAVLQNLHIAPNLATTIIELGPCGNVVAEAINNKGWVTGSCDGNAFLWRKALSDGDGGDNEDGGED
jgi:hypothetical protein